MKKQLFLIFSHTFTPAQEADARASLGAESIVTMPEDIKKIWGNVPPELAEIGPRLEPVRQWLSEHARAGDYVLIQGDFGACWLMVKYAFESGLIPVYSTTAREAEEQNSPDGTIKLTHHFRHQRFRKYGE
ncbi:MAG: CRISPR-associated protein Csx20 [Desulfococcaceae bacterium]|jgi:hypothetical protein|nr:CRISPR-associated protein Csx20 [Desulfococcaceae bacterium]